MKPSASPMMLPLSQEPIIYRPDPFVINDLPLPPKVLMEPSVAIGREVQADLLDLGLQGLVFLLLRF